MRDARKSRDGCILWILSTTPTSICIWAFTEMIISRLSSVHAYGFNFTNSMRSKQADQDYQGLRFVNLFEGGKIARHIKLVLQRLLQESSGARLRFSDDWRAKNVVCDAVKANQGVGSLPIRQSACQLRTYDILVPPRIRRLPGTPSTTTTQAIHFPSDFL